MIVSEDWEILESEVLLMELAACKLEDDDDDGGVREGLGRG